MHNLILANGRLTTSVAFGCGGLAGATGWKESRRLLTAAWDAGIRHFDVAPSYGFGEAEEFLGRMLVEFGPQATVTTKVGIGRGHRPSHLRAFVNNAARSVLRAAPKIRRRLGDRARANIPRSQFDPTFVRASVELSLQALCRDHIDILLLHEATALDLTPELISVLEDLRREGKIGEAGIGSRGTNLAEMDWQQSSIIEVAQTEWNLSSDAFLPPKGLRINRHGALRNLAFLSEQLAASPGLRNAIIEMSGIDPIERDGAVALLLALATANAHCGQIVSQSRDPSRIQNLAEIAHIEHAETIVQMIRGFE